MQPLKTFACWPFIILSSIAVIVILSLISLYLPSQGADIPQLNNDGRYIQLKFTITMRPTTTQTLINYDSLGSQMTKTLDLLSGTFRVLSAAVEPNTRRKRRLGTQQSCHGSATLNLLIYMGIFPKTVCSTAHCHQKFVDTIRTNILKKFGSSSATLLIELSVGQLVSTPVQICSVNEIAA
ncbi:unnamed protein product, partial [Rotaria magnacalcarata]